MLPKVGFNSFILNGNMGEEMRQMRKRNQNSLKRKPSYALDGHVNWCSHCGTQ